MTHELTYFENDQLYLDINDILLYLVALQQNEIKLVDTYNYGASSMWNETDRAYFNVLFYKSPLKKIKPLDTRFFDTHLN